MRNLAIALSVAALCACVSQRSADSEVCEILSALHQDADHTEAPARSAILDPINLGERTLHCGEMTYNGRASRSLTIVQSLAFTADKTYAEVYVDYGGRRTRNQIVLLAGDRFVLRHTDGGWRLVSRDQEWEF
jgi:hypothetical protein